MRQPLTVQGQVETRRCLAYCSLPYNGQGPAQTCISLLENFPKHLFRTKLLLPRASQAVPNSLEVKQALPFALRYLPWQIVSELGDSALNKHFLRTIEAASQGSTITYFWPDPPLSLVER